VTASFSVTFSCLPLRSRDLPNAFGRIFTRPLAPGLIFTWPVAISAILCRSAGSRRRRGPVCASSSSSGGKRIAKIRVATVPSLQMIRKSRFGSLRLRIDQLKVPRRL
jgi:hypothetical protein